MPYKKVGFYFRQYNLNFTAENDISLSILPEISFRGGFGYSFKKLLCSVRHGNCFKCIVNKQCPYFSLFESPAPIDKRLRQKYSFVPHPFVIRFPLSQLSLIKEGENFTIEVSLIGYATNLLPYIIISLEHLALRGLGKQKGKARLNAVYAIQVSNKMTKIYTSNNDKLLEVDKTVGLSIDEKELLNNSNGSKSLYLEFITPLRLKYNGSYRHDMSFNILIKNLIQRLSELSSLYLDNSFSNEFYNKVIEKSKNISTLRKNVAWQDIDRYSTRQNISMKLGGYIGNITYTGEIDTFLPLLKLGEYWHVGKASSFGCGRIKYKLE